MDQGPEDQPSSPPASSFQAYRTELVVANFPRTITSLCLWNEQLLVGLQDGTLLFFQRQQDASLGAEGAWQVVKAHRDVERKGVLQMQVVAQPSTQPIAKGSATLQEAGDNLAAAQNARHLLLSMTEDGINVRSLPDAMLRFQAPRSKGATCFAWSETRGVLAVAVRKRIQLYRLSVRERHGARQTAAVSLEEVADTLAPDFAINMMWAGDSLFLGCKRAYYLMQLSGPGLPTQPDKTEPTQATPLPTSQSMVITNTSKFNQVGSTSFGATTTATPAVTGPVNLTLVPGDIGSVGTALNPSIALTVTGSEVLLVRDNGVFCVDEHGQPTRRQTIMFTAPPVAISAGTHYVVALLPSCVEVRGLRRAGDAAVCQQLADMADAKLIAAPGPAADGSMLVALSGDQGVRRLVPVPLTQQAEVLATAGEYSAALDLAALLEDEEDAESTTEQREALENRLRLLYAYHLFGSGDYDEGMAQLALCSSKVDAGTAVLVLLRMLPSLVPDHLKTWLPSVVAGATLPQVKEPRGDDFATAASLTIPYLTSFRSRTMATHPELATERAKQLGGDTIPTAPEFSSTLSDQHHTDAPHQQSTPDTSSGSGEKKYEEVNTADVEGKTEGSSIPSLHTLLTIVDTAMVGAMLAQQEDTGTLLRFLQNSPHWVDLQDGERMLQSAGRYAELAALYKYHNKHEQALDILQRASQSPDELKPPPSGAAADLKGMPGVWAAVRYLTHLGSAQADLIRKHSEWILRADPEAGMQAFLQMQQPLEPSLALDILHTHSPAYSGMYLEAALELGVAAPQDYHSELLLIYLQELLEREAASPGLSAESSSMTEESFDEGFEGDQSEQEKEEADKAGVKTEPAQALEGLTKLKHGYAVTASGLPVSGMIPSISTGALSSLTTSTLAPSGRLKPAAGRGLRPKHKHRSSEPTSMSKLLQQSAHPTSHVSGGSPPDGKGIKQPHGLKGQHDLRQSLQRIQGFRSQGSNGLRSLLSPWPPAGSSAAAAAHGPLPLFPEIPRRPRDARLTPPPRKIKRPAGAPARHSIPGHITDSNAASPPGSPAVTTDDEKHVASGSVSDGQGSLTKAKRKKEGRHSHFNVRDFATRLRLTHKPAEPPTTAEAAENGSDIQPSGRSEKLGLNRKSKSVSQLKEEEGTETETAKPPPPPRRKRRPLYRRLRELVFTSPYLDPQHVLAKLPPGELPEIRALMLERLGHHTEALRLYVDNIEDMALAEAYCDRVYALERRTQGGQANQEHGLSGSGNGQQQSQDVLSVLSAAASASTSKEALASPQQIYLLLLKVVLESPDIQEAIQQAAQQQQQQGQDKRKAAFLAPGTLASSQRQRQPYMERMDSKKFGLLTETGTAWSAEGVPSKWQEIVWILGRKADRIDAQGILSMFPPNMPVFWLTPVVAAVLVQAEKRKRHFAVLRQLRRAENLSLRESVGGERSGRLVLTTERACCLCYKRIGLAVFVAYPDLSLAHYQCHKRRHPDQPTCVLQPPQQPSHPMVQLQPSQAKYGTPAQTSASQGMAAWPAGPSRGRAMSPRLEDQGVPNTFEELRPGFLTLPNAGVTDGEGFHIGLPSSTRTNGFDAQHLLELDNDHVDRQAPVLAIPPSLLQ